MINEVGKKFKESLLAVLPIVVIVLLLTMTITPIEANTLILFLTGALFVIVGIGVFTLGADISMMNIGERISSKIVNSKNIPFIAFICFVIGVIITMAEPDLKVLAEQAPIVENWVLIAAVSVGVGIFLVIAFLRILFQVKLSHMLIGFYIITFLLAFFTPNNFLAIAFDSGGVTTGPMTVPFILAIGVGLATVRGDAKSQDDTFGLVALCSIGPIITVLLLGLFNNTENVTYVPITLPDFENVIQVIESFIKATPHYIEEVFFALCPVIIFFMLFEKFCLKLERKEKRKIYIGIVYVFVGLVLFLTGVNIGFMPVGYLIGNLVVGHNFAYLLIPLGMLMGYFIVSAEPAVFVLKNQVEEITEGNITGKALGLSLGIGVAVSVGLAMIRVVTAISLWYFIIPGYLFALVMTFIVPPIFTAISFDSGGVASGPMTATFLLPFAMGACEAIGGNVITDSFGVVTMVAMVPLIAIQMLGLIYKLKISRANNSVAGNIMYDDIIDCELEDWGE